MPTALEDIDATIALNAAALRAAYASPKPSYSKDGQSFDWPGWVKFLTEQLAALQKNRQALDPVDITSVVRGG